MSQPIHCVVNESQNEYRSLLIQGPRLRWARKPTQVVLIEFRVHRAAAGGQSAFDLRRRGDDGGFKKGASLVSAEGRTCPTEDFISHLLVLGLAVNEPLVETAVSSAQNQRERGYAHGIARIAVQHGKHQAQALKRLLYGTKIEVG